jgi:hypothetical protein
MSLSVVLDTRSNMADAKMEVSPDRLLKGKANFVTWNREFQREAKSHDVLNLLTGDKDILSKPKSDDYLLNLPVPTKTRKPRKAVPIIPATGETSVEEIDTVKGIQAVNIQSVTTVNNALR